MTRKALNRGQGPMRIFGLLAATIILVSMSSGCINASWTKNLLNPAKPAIVLQVNEKLVMKHFFKTDPFDLTTLESHMTNTTKVKDGTRWMSVHIGISMDQPRPEIQQLIQTVEKYLGINITRYVTINITMPDGTGWYDKTFNATMNTTVVIESPEVGEWTFTVNAVGLGADAVSSHDGYSVIASAYEPTKST